MKKFTVIYKPKSDVTACEVAGCLGVHVLVAHSNDLSADQKKELFDKLDESIKRHFIEDK